MPQLDLATYSSQIFWFAVCFAFLYIYASKLIIPRIKAITSNRSRLISTETNQAFKLEQEIKRLKEQTESLKNQSNIAYKNKLDETEKWSISYRQKALNDLKQKIEIMSNSSRQEIIDFATHSEQKKEQIVSDFIKSIKTKIFS